MTNFTELPFTTGYGYEVDPHEAEELGAFEEEALTKEDAADAVEDEA